jgi:hypothetical protein
MVDFKGLSNVTSTLRRRFDRTRETISNALPLACLTIRLYNGFPSRLGAMLNRLVVGRSILEQPVIIPNCPVHAQQIAEDLI